MSKKLNSQILKPPSRLTRMEKKSFELFAANLRQEFQPELGYEEFVFQKLLIDILRLRRLYEFERDFLYGWHDTDESNLERELRYGHTTSFLKYKASVEQDIKDAHTILKRPGHNTDQPAKSLVSDFTCPSTTSDKNLAPVRTNPSQNQDQSIISEVSDGNK